MRAAWPEQSRSHSKHLADGMKTQPKTRWLPLPLRRRAAGCQQLATCRENITMVKIPHSWRAKCRIFAAASALRSAVAQLHLGNNA